MIIPEKIIGRNKIRDAAICLMFEEWHDSELPATEGLRDILTRLTERFKLTERRMWQILRENHAYIPIDKAREKKRRILKLKRDIARAGNSKKDVADLMEQLRVEIEGDKPFIDQSKHTHITVKIEGVDGNKISTPQRAVTSIQR